MNRYAVVATAALTATFFSFSEARADETITSSGPDRALLRSGVVALAVPYVTSVIVATQSSRSEDKNLYAPVVGPWVDLANRSGCGDSGQPSCSTETAYKVLLIGSGILQGIGALEIVGAFLFPESHTESHATAPRVFVSPYVAGNANYGLSAVGAF
jgi:hypothetical protein